MSETTQKDPERPKRIRASYEELASHFDNIQQNYADGAEKAGWARDACKAYAYQFGNVADHSSFAYTEESIKKYLTYVEVKEAQSRVAPSDITSTLVAISTSSAVSDLVVSDLSGKPSDLKLMEPPPWWTPEKTRELAGQLEKVRPGLGSLLLSASQSFYSMTHEPERAALSSMRELFNQFFEVIAPDEEVRASRFFTIKEGEKPKQVYRKERLKYAAIEKVQDKELAGLLDAQINVISQAYDDLNKLHRRGKLNREDTRKAIISLQAFIEQFVRALNI